MAATESKVVRRSWPIAYRRRVRTRPGGSPWLAWALFLGLGLPLALMGLLTTLARAGIYVELLRPLWQPWPPDLLKPFVGVAGFAATLAYLSYRLGRRSGFRSGTAAGIASARNAPQGRTFTASPAATSTTGIPAEVPPPPPPEEPLA